MELMLPVIINRPVRYGHSIKVMVYMYARQLIFMISRVKTSDAIGLYPCSAVRFMELSRHPMKVLPSMILPVPIWVWSIRVNWQKVFIGHRFGYIRTSACRFSRYRMDGHKSPAKTSFSAGIYLRVNPSFLIKKF